MNEVVRTLLENWEQISIGAILLLILLGFTFLFFTDRLQSPKAIERILKEVDDLKEQVEACKTRGNESDKALQKAAAEIADARVLYVKAEAELTHLESLGRLRDQELADLRSRYGRLEGELEALRRWCQTQPAGLRGEPA